MRCPYCLNGETKVIDKRDSDDGIAKRRRECLKCEKRFNTSERIEHADIRVKKKDGKIEEFNPEKLRRGILRACEKRPVEIEQIDKMVANIEDKMRKKGKDIESGFIGELVSRELKKTDKISYIRFASVYKDFTDLDDFKEAIKELVKK